MEHLDFSDLEDKKPIQEFTIPQGREVGEYHVMYVSMSLDICNDKKRIRY